MNQQIPNPSPDNFDDIEGRAAMERKEEGYPKKPDGSVDLDALTPDERADYWKDRHDASTRGFHSYKSKTDAEIAKLRESPQAAPTLREAEQAAASAETMAEFEKSIPNFELLDDDTQANLRGIFHALESRVLSKLASDPGVAFARETLNSQKWDAAFNSIAGQFGEDLIKNKDDFKSKYFQPTNVPDNIGEILTQLAKSYLFDSAREAGAEEERQRSNFVDLERGNGGPKQPTGRMTIDDWEHLRKTNPQAFARRATEYNAQLAAGELAE